MRRVVALGPERVEFTGNLIQIEGDSMELMGQRGGFDMARIGGEPAHQREFRRIVEPRERCLRQHPGTVASLLRQLRRDLAGIAEYGLAAGVSVLDIEDRVVA